MGESCNNELLFQLALSAGTGYNIAVIPYFFNLHIFYQLSFRRHLFFKAVISIFVDLHIHTQFSDGTFSPEQIVSYGKARGYGVLAIADHNRYGAWDRFSAACRENGIIPVRGMEMDCLYAGLDLHVLAYQFMPTPRLSELASHSAQLLLDMSDDLIQKLIPLFPVLSWESYQSYPFDRSLGGWQALHYLVHAGIISTPEDGMRLYTRYGCDYADYPFPPVGEVISAIHEAGGKAVLAHPGNWFSSLSRAELYQHFDALRSFGLDGIECYYPAHSSDFTVFCRTYCDQHQLLVTTGSDFHGSFSYQRHGITYDLGILTMTPDKLRLNGILP